MFVWIRRTGSNFCGSPDNIKRWILKFKHVWFVEPMEMDYISLLTAESDLNKYYPCMKMNPDTIYIHTFRPVAELFYDIILAVIFNFDIINIKDGPTRWRLVFNPGRSQYRDSWKHIYYLCASIGKGKYS